MSRSRQLLASESSLQFSFDKTYRGCDLERYMQMTWRIYSEQQLYLANILGLGGRGRVCVDIVQELSPTSWVLRIDERYNGLPVSFHELFLMFVIKTAKGAVQFLTCIHNNDLQNAINSPIELPPELDTRNPLVGSPGLCVSLYLFSLLALSSRRDVLRNGALSELVLS